MVFRQTWAIERGALWAMELDGNSPPQALPHIAATFGELGRLDAPHLAAAMHIDDITPITRRFDTGRRCIAALVNGDIAAYGWISQSGVECIGELNQPFHIAVGEAYIWDCATLVPYRNQHLYRALLCYAVIMLRGEGIRRLWIGAMLRNLPSLRGMNAAGFQPVVTITYARLFSLHHRHIASYATTSPDLVTAARRCLITCNRGVQHDNRSICGC
ncbi:MAG TPA: GNAT family N-acetyltransferase [Ktedonobacterales bacterium]|nr:GNAT family N-acetyltransferase [Ktedonobacterales bacterium]